MTFKQYSANIIIERVVYCQSQHNTVHQLHTVYIKL